MQIILTEEEYNALKNQNKDFDAAVAEAAKVKVKALRDEVLNFVLEYMRRSRQDVFANEGVRNFAEALLQKLQ